MSAPCGWIDPWASAAAPSTTTHPTTVRVSPEQVQQHVAELEAEVELLAAELQRRDNLLATLGHELRNPLGPIRAAVELWRHHGTALTDDQRQRTVEVVGRQADHLAHLVDDLLDVSRVNPGAIRLRRSALDLREILEQSHDIGALRRALAS